MLTFFEANNDGSFVEPQWVITPLPGQGKWLLVLSGVVVTNFVTVQHSGWRRDKVQIFPRINVPLGYAMQAPPPPGSEYLFDVEQYATFGGLSSIFDRSTSVNAGFAVDAFRPIFAGNNRLLKGIELDIAAQDRDAELLRVNYQLTAVGSIQSVVIQREVKKQPWAILVCKFTDDQDPSKVLVRNLPGLGPGGQADNRTALQLFQMFFTNQGVNTFNAVRYFQEMSHGALDLSDSQVFVVNLDMSKAQNDALSQNPGGYAYEVQITQMAQKAAIAQGVPLQNFYGIVITSHALLAMAQGGSIPGGGVKPNLVGWAGMDYRWVRNNGIQSWGQEMGHGYGLDHSRSDGILIGPDGVTPDYTDQYDIMSTRNAFSGQDPDYGMRGPGINAWNMRCRQWLDESRVWHCPAGPFDQTIDMRPLHRRDLSGYLAAELPPMNDTAGFPRFLVEYRVAEDWDDGTPTSCIMIHHFDGAIGQFFGTHSYLCQGTNGQYQLVPGDRFSSGPINGVVSGLQVVRIDDANRTATIRVTSA
jgi:hypothetical protein